MQRLRTTMMFLPGMNPAMLRDAGIYGADALMFDLEDAVSPAQKDAARFLVHEALRTLDYGSAETVVRINELETHGRQDIFAMVDAGAQVIRLPKTETPQDIIDVAQVISTAETRLGKPAGSTKMMAAIESAEGVLNAREIAKASDRLVGIALGAEDYVTNLQTKRYPDGQELAFGRAMILHAARAAGIDAIDTVYSDVENEAGFRAEVALIKELGFNGKSVINPRQIPIVKEIFAPTQVEIYQASRVIKGLEEAKAKGSGVISVDGKMVDKPIVERAQRVMQLAAASGLVKQGGNN
ncbi:HpcH/HpaI aldolase/citrate lyase family protein [Lactobacillus sp. CC-MHH1034]|uniref:aldolase/citrate lyase family protein n=1 Tax=Agrilactobacillus fermenti TaxID=2586909 RepID=UPI001E30A5B3|nr:aldolase/citrate lyase family protein [Agrilactobacillus fermenti]MCD2257079.1 HpcH/HpaI aldolase/citrate lyase family protein [Agrilactobacillus fermenti]